MSATYFPSSTQPIVPCVAVGAEVKVGAGVDVAAEVGGGFVADATDGAQQMEAHRWRRHACRRLCRQARFGGAAGLSQHSGESAGRIRWSIGNT